MTRRSNRFFVLTPILILFLACVVFVPVILAAPGDNPFSGAPFPRSTRPPASGPVTDLGSALSILLYIVNLAQIVFWIMTVGFALYGAYLYLFAVGDKESAAKARKVFIYAVIAALLSIVAYGIPGIVADVVGF
jgi:hypothetical protein